MKFAYLLSLVSVILLLLLVDRKMKLAFYDDAKRTIMTLATSIVLFLVWDVLGVWLGIFFPGDSAYILGIMVFPDVPLEELFFLFLLSYVTLIIWRAYGHLRRT